MLKESSNNDPSSEKSGAVALPPNVLKLCKRLAKKYDVTHTRVVEIALESVDSHLDHTAAIQIPQLAMAVTELREQVAVLIGLGEDIEQLGIELMASEYVPNE